MLRAASSATSPTRRARWSIFWRSISMTSRYVGSCLLYPYSSSSLRLYPTLAFPFACTLLFSPTSPCTLFSSSLSSSPLSLFPLSFASCLSLLSPLLAPLCSSSFSLFSLVVFPLSFSPSPLPPLFLTVPLSSLLSLLSLSCTSWLL